MLTLVHVFAHNSKSILPQSASFSHAGTQIVKCVCQTDKIITYSTYSEILLDQLKTTPDKTLMVVPLEEDTTTTKSPLKSAVL